MDSCERKCERADFEGGNEFFGENDCGRGRVNPCKGIELVKEGEGDIVLGLKEIEKAKKQVDKAIAEVEHALKELLCCRKELEKAGCLEKEGLKDINRGIHIIEDELKKPLCFSPICR
jgi:hypothetical protein